MLAKKDLVIAVLATFCLTTTVFMIRQAISPAGEYDPWLDTNDDGQINIIDIAAVARAFGTSGQPIDKSALQQGKIGLPPPDYDSGWVSLSPATILTLSHNLGTTDVFVYVVGGSKLDSAEHQVHQDSYGGDQNGNQLRGCTWILTSSSINIYRWPDDTTWLEVRVRIWRIQPAT